MAPRSCPGSARPPTPLPTRRRWLVALTATVAIALSSCIAPTLPVPPPSEPDSVTADAATGKITVTSGPGSVQASAQVNCTNYSAKLRCPVPAVPSNPDCDYGTFKAAEKDGSYFVIINGRVGDRLFLSQSVTGGESAEIEVKATAK